MGSELVFKDLWAPVFLAAEAQPVLKRRLASGACPQKG